ncbi:hypothetical protein G6O69_35305 [Pseudenhygromyxa sp. WMMC2535]|uniref:hypothetical protein n=1 Tax=Pseudenhygromyxa sp. WMMC2535 TaxID=2712867 RepID=UPI0015543ED8|nr:hypothetical protein [Pseudenhygromyxa sp. WMMC2535]NVB43145.1 hypothetical protein [Pseudenhygromyxa sp. WMMC2535]
MSLRATALFTCMLAAACSQVSADVSSPDSAPDAETADAETADAETADAGTAKTSDSPAFSGECLDAELGTCARACRDRECLAWCGGEACAAAIAELHACIDDAELRFTRDNPVPEFESSANPDAALSEDDLARLDEWNSGRNRALQTQWAAACESTCETLVSSDEHEPPEFCTNWTLSFENWGRLSAPPRQELPQVGILGVLAIRRPLELVDAPALTKHRAAVAKMVEANHVEVARGLASCVPEVDGQGVPFQLEIDFAASGAVASATLRSGDPEQGACVTEVVAAKLALPTRVAREVGTIVVNATALPANVFPNNFDPNNFGVDSSPLSLPVDWQ